MADVVEQRTEDEESDNPTSVSSETESKIEDQKNPETIADCVNVAESGEQQLQENLSPRESRSREGREEERETSNLRESDGGAAMNENLSPRQGSRQNGEEEEPKNQDDGEPPKKDGEGESSQSDDPSSTSCTLFIGNLPYRIRENDLRDLISETGEVTYVMVGQDFLRGRSKGYAFVTLATNEEAKNTFNRFNKYVLHGRELRLDFDDGKRRNEGRRNMSPRRRPMDRPFSPRRRGYPQRPSFPPRGPMAPPRMVPPARPPPRFRPSSPLPLSPRFRSHHEPQRMRRASPPPRSPPYRGRPLSPPGRNFGYGPPSDAGRDRPRLPPSRGPPLNFDREYEKGRGRSPDRYERSPSRNYGPPRDRPMPGPPPDRYPDERGYGRERGYERNERDRYNERERGYEGGRPGERGANGGYGDRRGAPVDDRSGMLKRGQPHGGPDSPRKRPRLMR